MRIFCTIFLIATVTLLPASSCSDDSLARKNEKNPAVKTNRVLCSNVIGVINPQSKFNENYVFDESLYRLRIDTLAQIKFWRNVMNLHEDTAYINVAGTRQLIHKVCVNEWGKLDESTKKCFRDSVRICNNLDSSCRLLYTTGKRFFYDFERASQFFQQGIHCFVENKVDPWYAQAILLIESPNKLQKSNAGAYGPFQLMKDVARMYGLKVNREIDERADFDRSAYAASCLIRSVCIPGAYRLIDSLHISDVKEEDLWFRLLVMHIYHAGFYNVQKALLASGAKEGNMELIYRLWNTETARFKSASQNYSQVILAAMLEMNERFNVSESLTYRD